MDDADGDVENESVRDNNHGNGQADNHISDNDHDIDIISIVTANSTAIIVAKEDNATAINMTEEATKAQLITASETETSDKNFLVFITKIPTRLDSEFVPIEYDLLFLVDPHSINETDESEGGRTYR